MDDKLKKYLDQKFKSMDQRFEGLLEAFTKEVWRLDKKIDLYRAEIVEFKNGVYDKMDEVYKEVLDMRTEQAMHTGSHQRIDDELAEHDKRIKKLESSPAVAHSVKKN